MKRLLLILGVFIGGGVIVGGFFGMAKYQQNKDASRRAEILRVNEAITVAVEDGEISRALDIARTARSLCKVERVTDLERNLIATERCLNFLSEPKMFEAWCREQKSGVLEKAISTGRLPDEIWTNNQSVKVRIDDFLQGQIYLITQNLNRRQEQEERAERMRLAAEQERQEIEKERQRVEAEKIEAEQKRLAYERRMRNAPLSFDAGTLGDVLIVKNLDEYDWVNVEIYVNAPLENYPKGYLMKVQKIGRGTSFKAKIDGFTWTEDNKRFDPEAYGVKSMAIYVNSPWGKKSSFTEFAVVGTESSLDSDEGPLF
ncbi:hypothetical protein HQ520_13685 [bacterium]|nr:hypothetical protein [bacterium]